MRLAIRKNKDGNKIIDLIDIESWNEFDAVSKKAIKLFSGVILKKYDGPEGTRRWNIKFNNSILSFDFDDMLCMSIKAKDISGNTIVTEIATYLEGQ